MDCAVNGDRKPKVAVEEAIIAYVYATGDRLSELVPTASLDICCFYMHVQAWPAYHMLEARITKGAWSGETTHRRG